MPIYGYTCEKCEHEFELLRNVNDSDAPPCPKCSGKTRRLYFPVGIVFKGSGFHVTDYPSKRRKASDGNGADKSTQSDGEAAESAKTPEATPAPEPSPVKTS